VGRRRLNFSWQLLVLLSPSSCAQIVHHILSVYASRIARNNLIRLLKLFTESIWSALDNINLDIRNQADLSFILQAHFSFKRFSFNNSRASEPSNHPNRNRISSPGSQEGLQSGQLSVHKDVQITRDDRSPFRIQSSKSSSSGILKPAFKVPGGPADLNSSPPPFYSVAGVSTSSNCSSNLHNLISFSYELPSST
jgi:hypothetical protein